MAKGSAAFEQVIALWAEVRQLTKLAAALSLPFMCSLQHFAWAIKTGADICTILEGATAALLVSDSTTTVHLVLK